MLMRSLAFGCVVAWLCVASVDAQETEAVGSPYEQSGKYRLWFTQTYGDDHLCLTEIEFYAVNGTRLTATVVSMSSCYGCASCDGCVHRYGNPNALFDGDTENDGPSGWACTSPGTFTRTAASNDTYSSAVGSQSVSFTLNGIPNAYVLQRPQVNGDWVTKDYSLEAEATDGTWMILDTQVDKEKRPDQRQNISGAPQLVVPAARANPLWGYDDTTTWVKDYPACSGSQQSPIDLEPIFEGRARGETKLPFVHTPMTRRAVVNYGKGVQVPGRFGNLTLPSGVHQATMFNFHFPAEHRIGGEDHLAIGEMQFVFQKEGSRGSDGLAFVSVMLHLPLESEVLSGQEKWFIDMGMLAIPEAGQYSQPLSKSIDLSIFDDIFQGNYWQYTGSLTTPPCAEGVEWFIMEKHAIISGVVVQQFKVKFPDPMNARPIQSTKGRVVGVNTLPVVPEVVVEEE